MGWEVNLIEWLQIHVGSVGASIASFLSIFGEEMFLILVIGFLYWSYDKKIGRRVGLGAIMGITWGAMLKNIILRPRPYFNNKNVKILKLPDAKADMYDIAAQGYSFPSIHSINAVTVFGGIAENVRKKSLYALAVIIPLFTGISRFVLGAHYPTDVLAGWLIGLVSILIVQLLYRYIKNTLAIYGILLITAIPGFFFCHSSDYFTAVGLLIGFMAATLLDDGCVKFENTRKVIFMITRLLGGVLIYVILNSILKMPFSKEFLECGSVASLLVRTCRYAIISFIDFGIYPMLFRIEKGRKKE